MAALFVGSVVCVSSASLLFEMMMFSKPEAQAAEVEAMATAKTTARKIFLIFCILNSADYRGLLRLTP